MDVGAYVGDVDRHYNSAFPMARIHCFEPFDESYIECSRRVGSFAAVHKVAIAEETGVRTLNANRAPYSNSLLKVAEGGDSFVDPRLIDHIAEVSVQVVALDDFCQEYSIDRVQILKLDIQGCRACSAARRSSNAVESAFGFDLLGGQLRADIPGQAALCDLEGYLRAFGYRIAGMYDPHVSRNGSMAWADAIFIVDTLSHRPGVEVVIKRENQTPGISHPAADTRPNLPRQVTSVEGGRVRRVQCTPKCVPRVLTSHCNCAESIPLEDSEIPLAA